MNGDAAECGDATRWNKLVAQAQEMAAQAEKTGGQVVALADMLLGPTPKEPTKPDEKPTAPGALGRLEDCINRTLNAILAAQYDVRRLAKG